jgi:coenzyme F420-reducing hydrogenase delta subunit
MNGATEYQSEIIAFCCMHCAYAAADLAGSSRLEYPTALKIVAIPCTGRTDMGHILRSFEDGADGVLVAGCLPGRCHYINGNLYARQRVDYLADLLEQIGLQRERVRMINVSAGMGAKFAELANEFAETIEQLGPTGLKRKPRASGTSRIADQAEAVTGPQLAENEHVIHWVDRDSGGHT